MPTKVRVLPTPEAIGEDVGERLLGRIGRAREFGRRFLLGCPTGRTPRPVFAAMARRLEKTTQDLAHVVLVMMDEYLVAGAPGSGLAYASPTEPWSCHYFSRVEIATFDSDQYDENLANGEVAVAHGYSGNMIVAIGETGPKLALIPRPSAPARVHQIVISAALMTLAISSENGVSTISKSLSGSELRSTSRDKTCR